MSKADGKINNEMLEEDWAPRIVASLNQSKEKKLLIASSSKPYIRDLDKETYSYSHGEKKRKILILSGLKAENANDCAHKVLVGNSSRSYIPDLNEEPNLLVLTGLKEQDANDCATELFYELLVEIFARLSCSKYWKLQFLNSKFSNLLKSSEIFRVRQARGLVKPYVLMLTVSDGSWTMFDQDFKNFQKLPKIPSDFCFSSLEKESICVGTQLITFGREIERKAVWRYELEMCKWVKGPAMITPRSMFGSASCGKNAFIAGGIKIINDLVFEVVNVAEKYNVDTKTWTPIHGMHKRRKFSVGCFFRGNFYVIGGKDENDHHLTCGEIYDEVTNSWKLIPDMIKDVSTPLSPLLIVVVNDNLYLLDTVSNELHVYDINTNIWKKLGVVPVRADSFGGFAVAFKSIGDRLLLIGCLNVGRKRETMSVFTCRPSTNIKEIIWEKLNDCYRARIHHFLHKCCVMFA